MTGRREFAGVPLPSPDDIDGWGAFLDSVPGLSFQRDSESYGRATVSDDEGRYLGFLYPHWKTGELSLSFLDTKDGPVLAVDLEHGGSGGMVATVLVRGRPLGLLLVLDTGHQHSRMGPGGELVTETCAFGPHDRANVEASVVEERYYRLVDGELREVAYAERGSLHATSFAVAHYYEMLVSDPGRAPEKLTASLRNDDAALDAATRWALRPNVGVRPEQSMTREVPLYVEGADESPVGYWLVDWHAASRQWRLESFRLALADGPWATMT